MGLEQFDISNVPKDGYLIFPLSMGRLANAQSGKAIYDFLEFFESKVRHISIDCIFLYTNDLYLNSDDTAIEVRKRSLNQMLSHKGEFVNILLKERKYVPQAFHFLPWDYVILNGSGFYEIKETLTKARQSNIGFENALSTDLVNQKREKTETNFNFLLEEIAVTILINNKMILLPSTLASDNGWRLVCYPGQPISSLVYAFTHNLLGKELSTKPADNPFARSFYNMTDKVLIDFDRNVKV